MRKRGTEHQLQQSLADRLVDLIRWRQNKRRMRYGRMGLQARHKQYEDDSTGLETRATKDRDQINNP
jgi:hypothetical protein